MADANEIIERILAKCLTFPEIDKRVNEQMEDIKAGRAHFVISKLGPGRTIGPMPDMTPIYRKQGVF